VKSTVDQRHNNRYRLAAQVSFTWENEDHSIHQGYGFTRDCGVAGAFVVTTTTLPIGKLLQMDFALPPLLAAGRGARLKTYGRIVRSDSDGFAVIADLGPDSLLHQERSSFASLGSEAK